MSKEKLKVGRPYSTWRISAYECEVDDVGNPTMEGKRVTGWYGPFTPKKLRTEIMPKLCEYAAQGRRYPFLITVHRLKDDAEVTLPQGLSRKLKASDVKFSPRPRSSARTSVAIVYSSTRFREIVDQ